jgi:hypothetical protein
MGAIFNLTGSLVIERGAAYSWSFNLDTPSGEYDLVGYVVSGYIQRTWDKYMETPWNAEIISTTSGIVNMTLTPEQTAGLSLAPLEHQIYIIPPNTGTVRILKGNIIPEGGLSIF